MISRTIVVLACALMATRCSRPAPEKMQASASAQNAFVQPKLCVGCHAEIARKYSRTGMAQAFYTPSPGSFPLARPYFHRASGTWFQMVSKDGAWFQRSWQVGLRGQLESVNDERVDYVMGSGNHARTYLHRATSGTLVELPLAWYSEKGGTWAMNPGFDTEHPEFGRKIGYDCMFCHNSYPALEGGADPIHLEPGAEPVFPQNLPQGIDCQRCHGAGAQHVRAAQKANAQAQEIRASIVNPARLSASRKMDVCSQCHLETTSAALPNAIRRFDRGPFSYQAGEPLSAFQLVFDHAPGSGKQDKFEIVSSVYRLRQSRCFLESKGALTCTTCHDPHDVPHGPDAAAHYNAVCQTCHAQNGMQASTKHPPDKDCVVCHMPKRRTEDVVHAVMTDHLIQRRPAVRDLLAERSERHGAVMDYRGEVVPYGESDELYAAIAQVSMSSNLGAGTPKLEALLEGGLAAKPAAVRSQAYVELGDALQRTSQFEKAAKAYRQALTLRPGSAVILRRLAMPLRSAGETGKALEAMRQSAEAGSGNAEAWHGLGLLQSELGDKTAAVQSLRKATALDPGFAEAHNDLGATLIETGQTDMAEAEFRTALRLNPTHPAAHSNLGYVLAARNQLEEAIWHFARGGGSAREQFNYGVTLARVNRIADAQAHLEASLKQDSNQPVAHDFLGNLLESRGRAADALAHYREAVRIRPDFGKAHLDLGTLLLRRREREEAQQEFRKAAADTDPQIRAMAEKGLAASGVPR